MSNYDHFAAPGTALAHTNGGAQPVTGITAAGTGDAVARATWSNAPFVGRGSKCSANKDTCEANRVKGETLCAGHLRSARKADSE